MIASDAWLQYMTSLEQQLQVFNVDNDRLRAENISLKRKLALLLSEVYLHISVYVSYTMRN